MSRIKGIEYSCSGIRESGNKNKKGRASAFPHHKGVEKKELRCIQKKYTIF